jgi:hypothetical protein
MYGGSLTMKEVMSCFSLTAYLSMKDAQRKVCVALDGYSIRTRVKRGLLMIYSPSLWHTYCSIK